MSHIGNGDGFAKNRFGTNTGNLTGTNVEIVTDYEAPDSDYTEIVRGSLVLNVKSDYASYSATATSYAVFRQESNSGNFGGYDHVLSIGTGGVSTYSGSNGPWQINFGRVNLFYTAPDASGNTAQPIPNFSGSNIVFFGTAPYASKTGGGTWGTLSDERLKQNIRPISSALEKLTALNPCHFEFKNVGEDANPAGTRTGFIAQEFEQVLPGHTFEMPPMCDADKQLLGEGVKAKGIEADLVPYLVKATQELNTKLEQENLLLKQQLAALSARLDALEAK